MKPLESITDPVGRRTYSPDEEVARKAPAVICAVASRTVRLREALAKMKANPHASGITFNLFELSALLSDYVAPLPFESELLSGQLPQVDDAIRSYPA
jgi:hypothetical protein